MTATFPTSHPTTHPTTSPLAPRPARLRLRGAAPVPAHGTDGSSSRTARAALAEHLSQHDPLASVDLDVTERTWRRVGGNGTAGADLWLITWPPGTSTGWHDHGSASGAFVVLAGTLTEYVWTGVATANTLGPALVREFGSGHIHDVVNHGEQTAVSLHAYSPSLAAMTRYEVVRGRLQVTSVEQRGEIW